MNKRTALILTAVLSMASANAQTAATVTTINADKQLSSTAITVETGTYNGPLSSLLAAIAKTAGYGLILDSDVDNVQVTTTKTTPNDNITAPPSSTASSTTTLTRPVVYSFKDKPFNQVWPLIMDVYGLSYEVVSIGGQPVLRVGNAPIQRIVALKNADAVEATNQVKLFYGTPTYSEVPQKDAQGNVVGTTRTLADVKIDSPTLRVVPDVRSNSVIVRGTNKEVLDVTRILGQLDRSGLGSDQPGTATQTVQRIYSVKGQQADALALLTAQYPGLKVTPVGQTGQLVMTGPQNQIEAAFGLLGQVDKAIPSATATVQKTFQLVNASAEEVKATLEGTLAREVTAPSALPNVPIVASDASGNPINITVPNNPATPTTGTATTTQATTSNSTNAATIIADRRTNTLIVRGTTAQVNQIAELIPQLDQIVPQINLQVRIQEISKTAGNTLGLEWNAKFGNFNVKVGAAGLGAVFDPTQAFAGFNIFPTLTALENQGLTQSIYNGNVTMQSGQRALTNATGGAANASNTAAASIKSGGRIEMNVPSTAGNIVRQIDYGLNLDFFDPQVAPDGSITLRVRGQINDLKTAVPDGQALPNTLDFTNSEAQSTITFKNGETVLMSGLLSTTGKDTTAGVPYLSKIPVIGAAFGKQVKNSTDKQLLVIITGTIVK